MILCNFNIKEMHNLRTMLLTFWLIAVVMATFNVVYCTCEQLGSYKPLYICMHINKTLLLFMMYIANDLVHQTCNVAALKMFLCIFSDIIMQYIGIYTDIIISKEQCLK